jgi:hypothetical protein
LKLTAISSPHLKAGGAIKEIWKLDVRSSGTLGDLRAVLPAMAFAARNYVGTNTGKAIEIKVKEKKDFKSFLSGN